MVESKERSWARRPEKAALVAVALFAAVAVVVAVIPAALVAAFLLAALAAASAVAVIVAGSCQWPQVGRVDQTAPWRSAVQNHQCHLHSLPKRLGHIH